MEFYKPSNSRVSMKITKSLDDNSTPIDIQTDETLQFVVENIGPHARRILEVGCGEGRLASHLSRLGHEVVAIDSSRKAVARAKRVGVDARVARFDEFDDAPFDIILFTRSLHHLHPLESAINRAYDLTVPNGILLVEDFAYQDVRIATANWFYQLLTLLKSCRVLCLDTDSFGRRVLEGSGQLASWKDHSHEIKTAREMKSEISQRFSIQTEIQVPYLYRYVSEMVGSNAGAGSIVAATLRLEKETGSLVKGFFIGRRFVASRRSRQGLGVA
jgi:2-polyprenyl-3-methyl-5-hydroxy-6-metoxy-1,4-benzoquinol methylase